MGRLTHSVIGRQVFLAEYPVTALLPCCSDRRGEFHYPTCSELHAQLERDRILYGYSLYRVVDGLFSRVNPLPYIMDEEWAVEEGVADASVSSGG